MAVQKVVKILAFGFADGTNTRFNVDLAKDPYVVMTGRRDSAGTLKNWFADPGATGGAPTAMQAVSGCTAASIVGTVVTVTVPLKAAGTIHECVLLAIF